VTPMTSSLRLRRRWGMRSFSYSSNETDVFSWYVQPKEMGAPSWHEGLSPIVWLYSLTAMVENEVLLLMVCFFSRAERSANEDLRWMITP
jgi:hypothetical protein